MWRKPEKYHRFPLGMVVATPGALDVLSRLDLAPIDLIERHVVGDWGDVSDNDAAANNDAVKGGDRIHSVYCYSGHRLWVITEADRSVTTVRLPDDY